MSAHTDEFEKKHGNYCVSIIYDNQLLQWRSLQFCIRYEVDISARKKSSWRAFELCREVTGKTAEYKEVSQTLFKDSSGVNKG